MSYQSDMAAGFADAAQVLGSITANWNGKIVPIIIGDNTMMLMLVEGGFIEGFSFGFTCTNTDAPVDGRAGNRLVVNGGSYRVLKVVPNEGSPLLNVYCGLV